MIMHCLISFICHGNYGPAVKKASLGYSHYICSDIRLLPTTSRLTPIICAKNRPFGAVRSQDL